MPASPHAVIYARVSTEEQQKEIESAGGTIVGAVQRQAEFVFEDERLNERGKRLVQSFEGLAQIHHDIAGDIGHPVSIQYFEASIIYYLVGEYGKDKFVKLYSLMHEGMYLQDALRKVYGKSQDELEQEWLDYINLDEISQD